MIYLSIGSNLGNKLSNIRKAVLALKESILFNTHESIIIETKAILPDNSESSWDTPYLNMIIVGQTTLSPNELLNAIKSIELQIGRKKNEAKWAPRVIDIDILLYNDHVVKHDLLTIPHNELLNRPFLIHLLAMLPERYIPTFNINNRKIRVDQYAHETIDYNKLLSRSFTLGAQIVGILNITQNSFSDGGKYFDPDNAITHAHKLIEDGAEIIDIGAQSTRPGGIETLGPAKEYERLKPILDVLQKLNVQISIDTYHSELINKLLEKYQIHWINDVTDNLNKDTLKAIAQSNVKILTMHSLSIPPTKNMILPHNINIIESLQDWVDRTIDKMLSCGFNAQDIIIDPGIGFGKSVYQNIKIINNINNLNANGCKILIGHSRKSFIQAFSSYNSLNRDIETISISENLHKSNVDYIRVHNVVDHYRAAVANITCSISKEYI